MHRFVYVLLFLILFAGGSSTAAQIDVTNTVTDLCPASTIQTRGAEYEPGGIILTSFDRSSIWVYDIGLDRRYPLPETFPCGSNCHLSPDARWLTYFNDLTNAYNKMRVDGTERSLIAEYAGDVQWWSEDTFLIWTPGHDAYLRQETGTQREYLPVDGIVSIQPGGRWGLMVEPEGDGFTRSIINLEARGLHNIAGQRVDLGMDKPYFNTARWSPNGEWLAYVGPSVYDENVNIAGAEIFAVRPGDAAPTQWTNLNMIYGAVRINGLATGDLSWSPDGTRIAFWVTELLGPDPAANLGQAILHILNVETGDITVYCGYSTNNHTPYTPRLIWSPDSTHIAFGGTIAGDSRGYMLLALDTTTGIYTILSVGIYPALGIADVFAWGLHPR